MGTWWKGEARGILVRLDEADLFVHYDNSPFCSPSQIIEPEATHPIHFRLLSDFTPLPSPRRKHFQLTVPLAKLLSVVDYPRIGHKNFGKYFGKYFQFFDHFRKFLKIFKFDIRTQHGRFGSGRSRKVINSIMTFLDHFEGF